MLKHRTKGNDTLRQKLQTILDSVESKKEIYTNHLVTKLSQTNKNYSISPQRVHNLLKENPGVKFIKSGVWLKL